MRCGESEAPRRLVPSARVGSLSKLFEFAPPRQGDKGGDPTQDQGNADHDERAPRHMFSDEPRFRHTGSLGDDP